MYMPEGVLQTGVTCRVMFVHRLYIYIYECMSVCVVVDIHVYTLI